jgi:ribosomal protein L19E
MDPELIDDINDPTPWGAEESIREAVDKEFIQKLTEDTHAREVSENARQVRKEDGTGGGEDKGG